MHRILTCLFVTVFVVGCLISCSGEDSSHSAPNNTRNEMAELSAEISTERLRAHISYLASDELEGRAPGSRGEELTLNYLVDQYSQLGFRPGNPNGMFVQQVPLFASTTTNKPRLDLKSKRGSMTLRYVEDFMGWTLRKQETVSIDSAELVFVGYGIVAQEYDWNDYKDIDVSGKVIVMLAGDPPLADTTLFGGQAMTYYGRWTYKFEIAAQKGAAGAILVHNTRAAGYPWEVVSNSWSGEQFDIVRPNDGADRCALESWVTAKSAERVFDSAGMDLGSAYRDALARDFRPSAMGITANVTIKSTFRKIRSYNVIARLPGNDPELKDEYVMYTSHWDHLGRGNPVDGDSIYNGALDNASGVAATIEIARAFAAHKSKLKRSVLIMNTTAEESGLIGAQHYAEDPLYPLASTVALLNIDGLNVWGRTKDVVVVGYGFSDLDDYLRQAIAGHGRHLRPDAEPEKGYYYRSDHFPFAKKGVPALYADSGVDYIDRPDEWGVQTKERYTTERYHKPLDEYANEWDLSGAQQDIEALFRVGMMIAASTDYPQWSDKSEFKAIREASLRSGHSR